MQTFFLFRTGDVVVAPAVTALLFYMVSDRSRPSRDRPVMTVTAI